jgi:hypothetical protein
VRPEILSSGRPPLSPLRARRGVAGRRGNPSTGKQTLAATLLTLAAIAWAAGCSLTSGGVTMPKGPVSVQKLEYYPYQVKGYQNTYPDRSLVVLMPVDARPDRDPGPDAPPGKVFIGVIEDRDKTIIQRLYSDPLPAIVQHAIVQSAGEAGLRPTAAAETNYVPDLYNNYTYVLQTSIVRCWVTKRRGADGQNGPTWRTAADFGLKLALYKPPFKIPFWQGSSDSTYNDPPIGTFGLGPEDEVGIYDEPGQDLSVALTRGVAGIFQHQDLHTLIVQDVVLRH